MPRLLQWLRDKNNTALQSHSYQQKSKPSHREHSTRSDVEAGAPWDGSSSTAAIFADNYIRLEEQSRIDGTDSDFELQRDQPEVADSAPLTHPFDPPAQDTRGVSMIVRMETSYSVQDNIRPPYRIAEVGRQGAVR